MTHHGKKLLESEPPRTTKSRTTIVIRCVFVLALVMGAFTLTMFSIPFSRIYQVTLRAQSLPLDDKAFRSWIKSQPGVVEHSVHIHRTENKQITITFLMSQNGWGYPPFPNLESASLELGYDIGSNRFVDDR